MNEKLKQNIIKAISYSRLVEHTFSPGQCIALQQWVGKEIAPNDILRAKLVALLNRIREWERPDLRYNESRELMIWNTESSTWTKIDN